MKKQIIVLALGLLAAPVATQAIEVEKEKLTVNADDNTVEEVIASYIKAIGGEAKMKAVRNMEMDMEAEIQGMKLMITGVSDQENSRLLNVTEMNGNVVSKTVVKDGAGTVTAMGQEQKLTDEQVATVVKNQVYLFRELFLDQLGITVTYEGTEELEGEQVHKLAFNTGGEGNSTEYYSVETGLKVQTKSDAAGTIKYLDYQEHDGLLMPMTMVISSNMMPMPLEAKVTSIKFNQELDDSIFN
ncbi:outer membrane lipoprotein-sorting protein [Algoriphagus halophytocola]|uniref:Outer membrane lipoprotein-sorting protein n=1 Tax=Algoriphagus halophytocola TaxID=2991499 RepID=A0ABY6MEJ4_9BACT|nr:MULTISPECIES: outer membrane lipoprotein-sorting protein [unclassified Algoriphagus]UZD22202.1 outer membrane lipoprotein-sorting protein [Algoriphagus sp. TR-M5]WBL43452.1 outer membrane lipoprotein-sorting protein [Algoriphagus sp. TR-M9]